MFRIFMDTGKIVIREAVAEDAPLIASVFIMALGAESLPRYCGENYRQILEELACLETTQYSFKNSLVAEAEGIPAGAAIGYDGARLHELRAQTLNVIHKRAGMTPVIEDETETGEFYIDSIGVLPEFRGRGIGKKLLAAIRDRAVSAGHERIGLLVDIRNREAEKLYLALGFKRAGMKKLLGHKMRHLQYSI